MDDKPDLMILHSDERLFAGAARNRGFALVSTDWVAFIDEDIIVDTEWHAAVLACISNGQADCILGSIGCAERGGYWGMSRWFVEFSSVHPRLAAGPVSAGEAANMIVHREKFASIGAFPEDWRMGEDTIAQIRMFADRQRLFFLPEAVGRHINIPGLRHMLRHLYHGGRFSAKVRRAYPERPGSMAVRVPILSFGLWLARLAQIVCRIFIAERNPVAVLILYTPGILLGLLAWNVGFSAEALRIGGGSLRY